MAHKANTVQPKFMSDVSDEDVHPKQTKINKDMESEQQEGSNTPAENKASLNSDNEEDVWEGKDEEEENDARKEDNKDESDFMEEENKNNIRKEANNKTSSAPAQSSNFIVPPHIFLLLPPAYLSHTIQRNLFSRVEHVLNEAKSIWDTASIPQVRGAAVEEVVDENNCLTNRKTRYRELLFSAYFDKRGANKLASTAHARGNRSDHAVSRRARPIAIFAFLLGPSYFASVKATQPRLAAPYAPTLKLFGKVKASEMFDSTRIPNNVITTKSAENHYLANWAHPEVIAATALMSSFSHTVYGIEFLAFLSSLYQTDVQARMNHWLSWFQNKPTQHSKLHTKKNKGNR
jgi:hypothetical protein